MRPFCFWLAELKDARYAGMSPFVMPRTRCGVGVTWGKPSGLRSSSISIDGSVLVDPKGVSKGGGCIEIFSGGSFTELVFAIDRGAAGTPCI